MTSERICLDVMGGDDAPDATLDGVLRAVDPQGSLCLDPARLLLVGDKARIEAGLAQPMEPAARSASTHRAHRHLAQLRS